MLMATSVESLQPENLRALDQLRVRLHTLSTSLGELRFSLQTQDPLPSWPQIQSSAQILSHHLSQLLETFQQNERFFKQAHAYPLPIFPGHTQHALLQQILRKKLEPGAEDWVLDYAKLSKIETGLEDVEQRELLNWAGPASQDIVKRMVEDGDFESNFTIKEEEQGIERIVTGIRRKLYEDDVEGEDDDKTALDHEKMDEDKPFSADEGRSQLASLGVVPGSAVKSLNHSLRFISGGTNTLSNAR